MKSWTKIRVLRAITAGFAWVALLGAPAAYAVESVPPRPEVAASLPVASDARVAGDERQSRFILDLDRKVDVHGFVLADPYRVVVDIPQVAFRLPEGSGKSGRGLVRAFRYGMVMPGASRIVMDLSGPAKIEKAYSLDAANGQPARLVVELAASDAETVKREARQAATQDLRPTVVADADPNAKIPPQNAKPEDSRPVIVLDPGHGGIDNGTVASSGENEKDLVLAFAKALRERIEKSGKYRVVMTRDDDTFIPLAERVKFARDHTASLFVSIHADALPKREGDAQGATIYTLSERASDAEAERLAESENKADAIAGIDLTEEPTEVADILIDLTQRETRAFSSRFAKTLVQEMKTVARMHKHPLKSAGFRVLKAHDVPSVLIELGYVSNKGDLHNLVSEGWRGKMAGSVAAAIDAFFGPRGGAQATRMSAGHP
ncbi:N-acetylmuramoyl-L-alanine amidase [[Pseudomonas] carboxydohydrogena]|uniref:N-acetylmuramoyl-L-alanine amidase n=1 Tax=Afipia carboxydohydrogena TaxID=290 RepID=A0ABY8BJX2_AFICR|nr:N-acetylmuramoyl-L-alanine amidase [[Pseudomonas] carboxydohydrogena]